MPRKQSFVTVTDQFCGAGGSSLGVVAAGAEVKLGLNHWKLAVETHAANFPDTDHDCTDISACDPRRYPSTDILITSPECFPAGTLILAERGLVPIEDIVEGDRVLTHRGHWRPVIRTMSKLAPATVIISGQGHPGLEVTPAHPFYVRQQTRRWNNARRAYDTQVLTDPEWRVASTLDDGTFRWGTPVAMDELSVPPVPGRGMSLDNRDFWWLVGRWLGDGTVRLRDDQGGEITICAGKHEVDGLKVRLSVWQPDHTGRALVDELRWRCREIRTAVLFECGHQGLAEWLVTHFGRLAHGKTLPAWALTLRQPLRAALLDGYLSADGSFTQRKTMASTVSKRLAVGIRLLAESLGFRAGLYRYKQHADTIEGRKVTVRDQWVVAWENNSSQRAAIFDGRHAWSLVKRVSEGHTAAQVYNLQVDDDESYVADGIVVHNCTNHSLAKGQKRSRYHQDLFGNVLVKPEEERSRATMWDVPRFAEYHRYNLIIVENVVDARDWVLYESWLHAMHALGYDHRVVYFNSMFAWPTPQSRDRMYVVFWRCGNPAPDLEFHPPAWCERCECDVEARQVWKQQRRQYGRYGARGQYVYRCPTCAEIVHPYYYPALTAIDWSLPLQRIGDRAKPLKESTLRRIRLGLDRFKDQELIVNLAYTHALNNRTQPVTEAWPTQTAQQTLGLIAPFLVRMTGAPGDANGVLAISDPLDTQVAAGSQHALIVELSTLR